MMAPRAATNGEKLLPRMAALANIILIGFGTVCLLGWLYVVYYYGWTGQRQFSDWVGVLLYAVSPGILAALLFASLRLRATHRINVALALCSVGVTVFVLEIGLSVWLSLPSVRLEEDRWARAAAAQAMGAEFDTRTRREVARDLVSQGTDAIPFLSPRAVLKEQEDGTMRSILRTNGVEMLPLSIMANKLVVLCNETGQFLTFKSDGHGFNNPPEVWRSSRANIAVLGDSFVHGYCVQDNFVTLIRRRYPTTLNLGASGAGPLVMLATLKEYARAVKPKVVLWVYFEGNDLKNLSQERKSPLLRRYLTEGFSQDLIERRHEIDRALADYLKKLEARSSWSIKREELREFFEQLWEGGEIRRRVASIMRLASLRKRIGLVYGATNPDAGVSRSTPEEERAQAELLYEILAEARRSVEEWDGDLYFVYLPQWRTYALKPTGPDPLRTRVLSAAKKAGLPVIDIHQTFKRHADPVGLFPLRLSGHYTEEGNRLIAAEVLRAVSLSE